MKREASLALAVLYLSFLVVTTATAQDPYNQGPVERVVLVPILPGHFDAFMAELKKNVVPLWESEKAAGLITDYQRFLNQTSAGAEDCDVDFTLTYKNMAALDGLPE